MTTVTGVELCPRSPDRGQLSGCSTKQLVAQLEPLSAWPVARSSGQDDLASVVGLEAVTKHRSVDLFKNVGPDLDDVIRAHPKDVGLKGRVVDLAQRKAIRHDGVAVFVAVGKDVGSANSCTWRIWQTVQRSR